DAGSGTEQPPLEIPLRKPKLDKAALAKVSSDLMPLLAQADDAAGEGGGEGGPTAQTSTPGTGPDGENPLEAKERPKKAETPLSPRLRGGAPREVHAGRAARAWPVRQLPEGLPDHQAPAGGGHGSHPVRLGRIDPHDRCAIWLPPARDGGQRDDRRTFRLRHH